MDELKQSVLDQISAAGGSAQYKDILASFPPEKRQQLPRILKQLRADGVLTQSVELVDGVVVHTLSEAVS